MKKIWLAIVGIVAMLGVLVLSGCAAEGTMGDVNVNLNSQSQGLWVSGEGKVMVAPDLAIINLGIESQEASVADAQTKANEAMDKVIQVLKDQGIDEKDIQTRYFNITKVTRWDNDKQTEIVLGFRVTNTVTVKVRDVEKAGEVIDAVVAVGGDLTRVNNIAFTVDDPDPFHDQARKLAIEDAKEKAQQMADESGIKLGKVTYITENSYNFQPIYRAYDMYEVAVPAPTIVTPIEAGELEITTTVQIAFEIEN